MRRTVARGHWVIYDRLIPGFTLSPASQAQIEAFKHALERLSKPYVNDAMRRPQSGVPLRDEGWRIEQVPVIDADRADGGVNTQPQPDGVGHVFEPDVTYEREHIADVVKGD